MKLRKNEMISPKNFFVLHWRRKKLHRRNSNFLGGELLDGDARSSSGASVSSPSSPFSAPKKYYCSQRKSSNL